ncbi:MAG: AAA family ATPase, partial [Terriglobia bacterium]
QLSLGVSPRGSKALVRAARALALLEGRAYCIPDDFKSLVLPVFAHRCKASARFAAPLKRQVETVLTEILEEVPIPL